MANKTYSFGAEKFATQELAEDMKSYVADTFYSWVDNGTVSTNLTPTKEITNYTAENIPNWIQIEGVTDGTGEIAIRKFEWEDYGKLANIPDTANGIRIGGRNGVKRFAISFDKKRSNNSYDKLIFFNAWYNGVPPVTGNSITNTPEEPITTIPVSFAPLNYIDADGKKQEITFMIVNSVKHPDLYTQYETEFVIPNINA